MNILNKPLCIKIIELPHIIYINGNVYKLDILGLRIGGIDREKELSRWLRNWLFLSSFIVKTIHAKVFGRWSNKAINTTKVQSKFYMILVKYVFCIMLLLNKV